ncbi:MAG: TIR domain-containing protein [Bacteroidota bacterium]
MEQQLLSRFQELIQQGEKLVPEGGLEFSGYNAKMQSQYLLWRKNCLDVLSKAGEKAAPLREKVTKDENGAYFYQNSAQLILDTIRQTLPMVESSAKKSAASAPAPAKTAAAPPKADPPQQKAAAPAPKHDAPKQEAPKQSPPAAASSSKQVFVLSSSETELQSQLTGFLKEINIEPVVFKRSAAADAIITFFEQYPNVKFAYYLFSADDNHNVMFELGYLVGRIGQNRIVCIHKKEDTPPKGVPGIAYKEIVVKLEEISFGLIKDLKSAGFAVSI